VILEADYVLRRYAARLVMLQEGHELHHRLLIALIGTLLATGGLRLLPPILD
jgi:hypothetical protein